ncbi:hypothetical protein GDO86_018420 [Hymenochirus boettgeri]|uniref:Uncharacterized protein n=1 Tax=Hymenochirus boettgeri TaxID=247094 RepID=A0A8T2ID88_9PIPI|nr:hypothetical protein GDO86_018420 [Hymenochirus boettgeri]
MCRIKATSSEWKIKFKILSSWLSVLQANHQENINSEELCLSVESECAMLKNCGINVYPLNKLDHEESDVHVTPEDLIQLTNKVQMWPLMEYLKLLWQYKLTADLLSHSYYGR